jgi:multidrug efflux system membrane fusion protein
MDQHVTNKPPRSEVAPREPAIRPPETRPETRPETPPATRAASRKRRLALGLALVLLAGAGLGWWLKPGRGAHHRPALTPASALPQPVREAEAVSGDFPVTLTELGTVTPVYTVTVISQIAGYLMNVEFQEGQTVKQGQEIALVDPRPYQVMLEQYEGQLAADQATLGQARMDLERYHTLNRQDSIARQTYEDQVYVVKQYEGKVKVDQAQIDNAKLDLVYCHVVAPITGLIGLRLVDPGNFVQPNSPTGVAVIAQIQPITVIFTLPEDSVPEVLAGLKATGALQVAAFDRSDTEHLADGTVYAIDSEINTSTGMVNLRAMFANKNTELFPNQFVNAHLLVKTLHNATLVPHAAVLTGAPGAYVYVIDPDHTVSLRPVTLGPQNKEQSVITGGLKPGEHVVVDGADRLRDGAKVAILQPAAATPAH